MNIRHYNRDIYYFLILFIFTVISVYYLPSPLNKLFFLALLPIAYKSKNSYFWITYLIIILSGPMRLFEDYEGDIVHRIPQYDLFGSYGLIFYEILLIVLFFKAIFKGEKNKLLLANHYNRFLVLIILLLIFSFMYGIETSSFISYSRKFLFFTLFYTFPRLIKKEDFIFLFKIFSIFTILTFMNQLLSATIGFNIADRIAGKGWVEHFFEGTEYKRAYDSVLAQFITFIFGLVLYSMKRPFFNKNLLIFIISISYLSIFITGTRGWMIAFSVALIYYFIFIDNKKIKTFVALILCAMILSAALIFSPGMKTLIQSNVQRLSTMQEFAYGDITAGGTDVRLTERLPIVVDGIKQHPILGWGFSKDFAKYNDSHVGFAAQIAQSGFIGLIILVLFLIAFWRKNKNINESISKKSPFKNSILALNAGIISLIIIHFSSTQIFGFSLHPMIFILVISFFLLSDLWQKWALAEEYNKKKEIEIINK